MFTREVDRRVFLRLGAAGCVGLGMTGLRAADDNKSADKKKPTEFQIACMTLPYSAYPLERALSGLKEAGYRFVAWGTNHKEDGGKPMPALAGDAPPEKAKELGKRCRDMGMEPVMMFGPAPEDPEAL